MPAMKNIVMLNGVKHLAENPLIRVEMLPFGQHDNVVSLLSGAGAFLWPA
jgi:hypothetical protein